MRIAIPVGGGRLSMHFGHCEQFAILDVDAHEKRILGTEMLTPPAHEPGALPRWLHQQEVDVIIAGGMGRRAQQLFAENDIAVVVGAPGDTFDELAKAYLDGTLQTGENVCDH